MSDLENNNTNSGPSKFSKKVMWTAFAIIVGILVLICLCCTGALVATQFLPTKDGNGRQIYY